MEKQITFYGEQELKDSLLAYTKQHQVSDSYIRGKWISDNISETGSFKGCFYGCMTQSEDNTLYKASEQYGLPLWYVHVTEKIYEGLPEGEWLEFPYQAIEVLPVGVDLNKVRSLWNYMLLKDQLRFSNGNENVEKAIKQCMELFTVPFDKIDKLAARSAANSAESAAELAAELAARSAASSAESAAESAAELAARSAASSAESAAELAAESAARSAASSAESAAELAAESAWSAYYSYQRDLLFKCIKDLSYDESNLIGRELVKSQQ